MKGPANGEKVKSATGTPNALTRATRAVSAGNSGNSVNLVLERTAVAWFVAGVAAKRAEVEHTLHRASGHKDAARQAFYRAPTTPDAAAETTPDRSKTSLHHRISKGTELQEGCTYPLNAPQLTDDDGR